VSFRKLTVKTPKTREDFLTKLREGLSIKSACEAAQISRVTAYKWRNTDPEFAADWDDAVEIGTDLLEESAIKRAIGGSDVLTIFLLKARRPEKYKERVYNEHAGKDGGPIQTEDINSARDELISRIAAIAERVGEASGPKKLN
jgi:terminase small subunit-like protein